MHTSVEIEFLQDCSVNNELDECSWHKFIGPKSTEWYYVENHKNPLKNWNEEKVNNWCWDNISHDDRR